MTAVAGLKPVPDAAPGHQDTDTPVYDDVDAPGHGDAGFDEGDGDGAGIE